MRAASRRFWSSDVFQTRNNLGGFRASPFLISSVTGMTPFRLFLSACAQNFQSSGAAGSFHPRSLRGTFRDAQQIVE